MNCSDIGAKVSRHDFLTLLNGVRGGQYFFIRGYTNSEGELADYYLRFGIKYANLKKHDVALLNSLLSGEKKFTIKVRHGVWVPDEMLSPMDNFFVRDNDEYDVRVSASYQVYDAPRIDAQLTGTMSLFDTVRLSNHKASNKTPVVLSYELDNTHPLVIAAIGASNLTGTLLGGLEAPKEFAADYEKQSKSCYVMERDGVHQWYLRDVMHVHKVVHVKGQGKFEASLPINAIKEAIKDKFMLTGKYRQFVLTEGKFESLTIEGQAVMLEDESFYMALPEHISAAIKTERIPT
jgi:hypothetical protein